MELSSSVKIGLNKVREQGLFRKAAVLSSRNKNNLVINGRQLVNFSSNDYLGLASHPRIIEAIHKSAKTFGFGSSASPLVCGKTQVHEDLEHLLAIKTGRDRALLFPSGYQANLGMLTALADINGVEFFLDRLCHASIIDGVRLSNCKYKRFAHSDAGDLEGRLTRSDSRLKLVLTEAVYSMGGDICPLSEMARSVMKQDGALIVDDAHGFGVMGEEGAGTLVHFNIGQDAAPLMVGTFGKALGLQGAFVAGKEELIELLVQKARPYIYSTAMPAPIAAGVIEALNIIKEDPQRRHTLFGLIDYFQRQLADKGIKTLNAKTPIQPIVLGSSNKTMRACEALNEMGVFVVGIRPPTVPEKTARIRVSINSNHSHSDLDLLAQSLASVVRNN